MRKVQMEVGPVVPPCGGPPLGLDPFARRKDAADLLAIIPWARRVGRYGLA
jgi:hypothetical protein